MGGSGVDLSSFWVVFGGVKGSGGWSVEKVADNKIETPILLTPDGGLNQNGYGHHHR